MAKTFLFYVWVNKTERSFFSFNSTFMCTGEDLDDSNTLRTGRVFLKAKKKIFVFKNTRIIWGPLNKSLRV